MFQTFFLRIVCAFGICALTHLSAKAQSETELTKALNQHIIPITTSPTDTNFADLEKLMPLIKDKKVLALGEATHGTHEFFAFKHRMLEFLVKEAGVKTFVIEADFAGTQVMNDYVIYGKGDVMKGLTGMGIGVWMTQEVADMANWIKAYNSTQTAENKVQFLGCDMQWGASALQHLKEYLKPDGRFTPVMEEALVAINKYLASINKADKAKLKNAIKELSAITFNDSDTSRTALNQHYVRELQQFADYLDAKSTFFPAKQDDVRDKYMAENCLWIYNHTGQKKMMIWAHNAHINRSSGSDRYLRMGMHLSNGLKDSYYAMGFDFFSGKMRAYNAQQNKIAAWELPAGKPGSTGDLFSKCNVPNFILDVKSASADPAINQFFNSNTASVFYGAGFDEKQPPHYITHKLSETFDAIIFIRETSAALDIQN